MDLRKFDAEHTKQTLSDDHKLKITKKDAMLLKSALMKYINELDDEAVHSIEDTTKIKLKIRPKITPNTETKFETKSTTNKMFNYSSLADVFGPVNKTKPIKKKSKCIGVEYFRTKHNNANWCNYCYENMYIHSSSCKKLLDDCISKFNQNQKRFFLSKNSRILGTILTLEIYAREYLCISCPELYSQYNIAIATTDSRCYVFEGMITHHVEKEYELLQVTEDINSWLMSTNDRCGKCNRLACPFHKKYAGFSLLKESNAVTNCCGWCLDSFLGSCKLKDSHKTREDYEDIPDIQPTFNTSSFSSTEEDVVTMLTSSFNQLYQTDEGIEIVEYVDDNYGNYGNYGNSGSDLLQYGI